MHDDVSAVPPVRNAMTDRVYAVLRGRIIDLDLAPGDRLQIERLSRDLDVSPTPVREALNRLTAEGIVLQEPYRGFRVSALLTSAELAELLAARVVIESAAASAAAENRSGEALAGLRSLVDEMASLAAEPTLDVKRFNAVDASFHRAIVASAGNRFLLTAFESLHAHVRISRQYKGRSVAEARRSNDEHRRLIDALDERDPSGAATVARSHIEAVHRGLQNQPEEAS